MKRLIGYLDLLLQSLDLDIQFWKYSRLSLLQKIEFICKKYYLLVLTVFKKVQVGKSHLRLFGKDFYYISNFGLAGFQRILASHMRLMTSNNIALSKFSTVLDVGAHEGAFTYLIKLHSPKCSVHSFEPDPKNYECLQENTLQLPKVYLNSFAVADSEGEIPMDFVEDASWLTKFSPKGQGVLVKTISLDTYCASNNIKKIDLLKIDVETFEHLVLKGSSQILAKTKYILMEVSLGSNKNYTVPALFSLLTGADYDFQLIGFRNFSGLNTSSYSSLDGMDCLFINTSN